MDPKPKEIDWQEIHRFSVRCGYTYDIDSLKEIWEKHLRNEYVSHTAKFVVQNGVIPHTQGEVIYKPVPIVEIREINKDGKLNIYYAYNTLTNLVWDAFLVAERQDEHWHDDDTAKLIVKKLKGLSPIEHI